MPINNPDLLKNFEERFKNINWDEINNRRNKEYLEGYNRVSNTKYLDWLTRFLNNLNEKYCDENWKYRTTTSKVSFTSEDYANERDLHYFYNFLMTVGGQQRVKEYHGEDGSFEEYEYVWKYKDKYYVFNTTYGQGSITYIYEIDQPNFCYVDLDKFFKQN